MRFYFSTLLLFEESIENGFAQISTRKKNATATASNYSQATFLSTAKVKVLTDGLRRNEAWSFENADA